MKVYAVGGYYSLVGLKIEKVFNSQVKAKEYINSLCAYKQSQMTIFEWEIEE